jgi:hypothetical protein
MKATAAREPCREHTRETPASDTTIQRTFVFTADLPWCSFSPRSHPQPRRDYHASGIDGWVASRVLTSYQLSQGQRGGAPGRHGGTRAVYYYLESLACCSESFGAFAIRDQAGQFMLIQAGRAAGEPRRRGSASIICIVYDQQLAHPLQSIRLGGATVARLTPDQKAGDPNPPGSSPPKLFDRIPPGSSSFFDPESLPGQALFLTPNPSRVKLFFDPESLPGQALF